MVGWMLRMEVTPAPPCEAVMLENSPPRAKHVRRRFPRPMSPPSPPRTCSVTISKGGGGQRKGSKSPRQQKSVFPKGASEGVYFQFAFLVSICVHFLLFFVFNFALIICDYYLPLFVAIIICDYYLRLFFAIIFCFYFLRYFLCRVF